MGSITSLGVGAKETWKALLKGNCGMKKYDSDRLACNVYATLHESYDKSKY